MCVWILRSIINCHSGLHTTHVRWCPGVFCLTAVISTRLLLREVRGWGDDTVISSCRTSALTHDDTRCFQHAFNNFSVYSSLIRICTFVLSVDGGNCLSCAYRALEMQKRAGARHQSESDLYMLFDQMTCFHSTYELINVSVRWNRCCCSTLLACHVCCSVCCTTMCLWSMHL